jgi:hypothetical protein
MHIGPPDPAEDDLAPLRGIVVALCIVIPFYVFVILLVF